MIRLLSPFLLLCLVGFFARFGYQMARPPVLPRFAQELGADAWLVGAIVGASTVTGVFIKFPAGTLSDILGRRRMLLLGTAFFAFPPFLYLLVDDPYALLGLRLLHGFATAIFSPVAAATVADLFQKGRGEKLGWFASANEVGSAFGPLTGGFMLGALAGPGLAKFHAVYLVVAVLGVFTFLLLLGLPVGKGSSAPPGVKQREGRWRLFYQGLWEVASNRAIIIASSVESAMFLGVGALMGFLPLYARNIVKLSDSSVAVLIWAILVLAMAGKPLAGRLSDRVGRKPVILLGIALCAAMLPLLAVTRHLVGLLVEGAIFGLGMAIVTPSTTALVADLCRGGSYGAALGVFGTIWDIGEALGPILAGVLIFAFGNLESPSAYLAAFGVMAALMGLVAALFAIAGREPSTGGTG